MSIHVYTEIARRDTIRGLDRLLNRFSVTRTFLSIPHVFNEFPGSILSFLTITIFLFPILFYFLYEATTLFLRRIFLAQAVPIHSFDRGIAL